MSGLELGTASASPGELDRGYLTVTDLPTGSPERLPVVLVDGADEGPTLWITGAIHGDEVTGLAVAQDVTDAVDPSELSGSVVCIPNLNPAGLRRTTRTSYYHGDDPNRGFPDPESERHRPPNVQELIDERVYDRFADDADALLDLHTATVGSIPFVIRDRVLYGERRDRDEAEALAEDLDRLATATNVPLVNEYAAEEYTGQSLQRSTAGAALNAAGIPALTFELGSHSVVDEAGRRAGLAGVFNAMVELGLLSAFPEATDVAPDAPPDAPVDYPVKRHLGPRSDEPGIARHRVAAGDVVEEGDVVADVVEPHGDPVSTVESDHDGYVLGRWRGVAVYENDPVASMAVEDDGDLVVPRDRDDRSEREGRDD
jgi:predicted deacylase